MMLSRTPIYNLGAVLKETGLVADTLRAWERRYGIPAPSRTAGGHRLYSERDIALIKWLKSRQAEGLTISRAIGQWKNLIAGGSDPLEAPREGAANRQIQFPAAGDLDSLRDQWLAACLRFDEATAERILNQAYGQYSVEAVTGSVVQRALRDVGEMWARGQASVQHEHFISVLTTRRLDALIAASPPSGDAPVVVLACAQGEPHSLPLLYLTLLLRRRGRNVILLGADVPIPQIAETVQAVNAAIVVLSAERLVTAATLAEQAVLLAKKRIPVAFGGRIFINEPEMQERIAGIYLGDEIGAAASRIDQVLDEPIPPARRMPAISELEAVAFRQARPRIERGVQQHFSKRPLPSRLLALANDHFGPGLAAALELGSVRYLASDVRWIHAVLAGHGLPARSLRDYLLAYADAIRKVMGISAADVTAWIRNYAARL